MPKDSARAIKTDAAKMLRASSARWDNLLVNAFHLISRLADLADRKKRPAKRKRQSR